MKGANQGRKRGKSKELYDTFSEIKVEEAQKEELKLLFNYLQNNSPDDKVALFFLAA